MKKLAMVVAAFLFAPPAWAAYKCVDEKGKSHFEDTPPPACANVVIYETSPSGAVVRKIEPSRTTEQGKQAEMDKDAIRRAADQKRRDRALLDSYTSENEFDIARDRNLDIIKSRLEAAKTRFALVDKRYGEVQRAIEGYKKANQKAPGPLAADFETLQAERTALAASIARMEKEVEHTRTQFDADKSRWLELRKASGAR